MIRQGFAVNSALTGYHPSVADEEIDLRAAVNSISDLIENRPRPLREFDQIYMKAGDMVLESELVGRWADGRNLVFVGDSDAIGIASRTCSAERLSQAAPPTLLSTTSTRGICNAVTRFAEKEGLDQLSARLYNVADPFPGR
jgi:predicted methyltransferase